MNTGSSADIVSPGRGCSVATDTPARTRLWGSDSLFPAVVALIGVAAILWIYFCRFPDSSWNDIRLLPSFMAAAGEPVYTLPGHGVVTTWMYGPVPVWFWMPSVFGSDPVQAVSIAGAINIVSTVAALAATCLFWPGAGVRIPIRLMALALVLVVWPEHGFRFLQADNVAVALALVANLLLAKGGTRHGGIRWWIAAAATAGFLGCKQTMFGIFIGQLVWLSLDRGFRVAAGHLARTALAGLVLAGIAVVEFGWRELWFGIVTLPVSLPSAPDALGRILELAPLLAVHWGLPLIAFLSIGRSLLQPGHPLRLPLFAWLFSVPLDLAGLLTLGGSLNNLHGFQLAVAPLLLHLLSCEAAARLSLRHIFAAATVAIIALTRIGSMEKVPFQPLTANMSAAMEISSTFKGKVWLPWNPLVSYFADGKFYHSEDGLYVRKVTGNPVSRKQALAHLPPRFSAVAYRTPRVDWGVAREFSGFPSTSHTVGNWEITMWANSAD